MLAISLDNLLFFLLIAAAALFQLLSKAISKAGKSESTKTPEPPTPQTPRPIRGAPAESDADRIRKFLEALGQPPGSAPPPPVAPRTDIPPRRLAPVQPPPVIPRAWRLPREQRQKPDVRQTESPPPQQPSRIEQIVPPPVTAASPLGGRKIAVPLDVQEEPIIKTSVDAYVAPKPLEIAKEADFKTDIAILIGSKSGLRDAILLREILGQPRGLRELELP